MTEQENLYLEINRPIIDGLKDIDHLRKLGITHNVSGSLIPAAIKGSFYREIGDIDLIVSSQDLEEIESVMADVGYESQLIEPPGRLGSKWIELNRGTTSISLISGERDEEGGLRTPLEKGLSLYNPRCTLEPTIYILHGQEFVGIPPEAAYLALELFTQIDPDPKRLKDIDILKQRGLDQHAIEEILASHPGLWFRNTPLPTYEILKFINGMRSKVRGIPV